MPKRMQRGLRVITLQGEIEKSLILEKWMIGSYFGGSNTIFTDCNKCSENLSKCQDKILKINISYLGIKIVKKGLQNVTFVLRLYGNPKFFILHSIYISYDIRGGEVEFT